MSGAISKLQDSVNKAFGFDKSDKAQKKAEPQCEKFTVQDVKDMSRTQFRGALFSAGFVGDKECIKFLKNMEAKGYNSSK